MTTHPSPKQDITVELSFGRFTTPSCVKVVGCKISGTKFDAPDRLPLHEVSAENLSILCDYLREDIFALARKQDPRQVALDDDTASRSGTPAKAVDDEDIPVGPLPKVPLNPADYQSLSIRTVSMPEEDEEC